MQEKTRDATPMMEKRAFKFNPIRNNGKNHLVWWTFIGARFAWKKFDTRASSIYSNYFIYGTVYHWNILNSNFFKTYFICAFCLKCKERGDAECDRIVSFRLLFHLKLQLAERQRQKMHVYNKQKHQRAAKKGTLFAKSLQVSHLRECVRDSRWLVLAQNAHFTLNSIYKSKRWQTLFTKNGYTCFAMYDFRSA